MSRENPDQLIIALEPEAASIYCRKLRLHQMVDLGTKTALNGYSPTENVGAGMTQGKHTFFFYHIIDKYVYHIYSSRRINQIILSLLFSWLWFINICGV